MERCRLSSVLVILALGSWSVPALGDAAQLCLTQPKSAVFVDGDEAWAKALDSAACGTEIVLARGRYMSDGTVRAACSADRPLIIRAETPQAAVLAGRLALAGRHAVVSGFTIDGGEIEVRGEVNRVTRNVFRTAGGLTVRAATASRIDHNEFATPAGAGTDVAFKFSKDDKHPARDIRVDHNLFRSRTSGAAPTDNDAEEDKRGSIGIYLGQFSARKGRQEMLDYGSVGTIVERNLFLDYQRRKAIHVKSLGNLIRENTLIDTTKQSGWSRITIRHGQFNEISDNFMDGTAGIQIFEERNSASGNVLTGGATLVVMGGGGEMTQFNGPQQRGAVDTRIVGNSGPLMIGVTYARRPNKTPATNTTVEGHSGPIEKLLEQGTVVRGDAAAAAVAKVGHLDLGDVGPAAPDGDCPAL